jgi:hypothetical protein
MTKPFQLVGIFFINDCCASIDVIANCEMLVSPKEKGAFG